LGLGLTIVKEVTELHGGSVAAASAGLGLGATFTIRLPRMVGIELPARSGARTVPEPNGSVLSGTRVLVVDDDRDSREVAATTLEHAGASVTAVSSGTEAIEAWTSGGYGALVCDLAMPDVDGFGVIERIRAFDTRAQRPTIAIAVTAHASSDAKRRSMAAGFRAHVTKPYDASELIGALVTAMRGLRSRSDPYSGRADFV
jgi:CheY-like chemotaxis protein